MSKRKLIATVRFPEYPLRVPLSKSRRAKYYKKLSDLPKNWNRENYYVKSGRVYRHRDHEPVLKNPRTAGKPKYQTLSGNAFWSGFGHHAIRNKCATYLKDYFAKELRRQDISISRDAYPLSFLWQVYAPPVKNGQEYDLSNLWFYYKMLEDTLRHEGILEEDSTRYVTSLHGPLLVPVESMDKRAIVLYVYSEHRPSVLQHPFWQSDRAA